MRIKINRNWNFKLGEILPDFQKYGYNDSGWRTLNVPHDWAIEGDFSPKNYSPREAEENHLERRWDSYLPRGTGMYRKKQNIPVCWKDQRVFLEFDGVFGESILYINGVKAGENHSGYTGKVYDITDHCSEKLECEIAMAVSAERCQGWWYEGAGIYRNVFLEIKPACHIVPWGIAITTPEITKDSANVKIAVELNNASTKKTTGKLSIEILDKTGVSVGKTFCECVLDGKTLQTLQVQVKQPKLWDIDNPVLYTARAKLESEFGTEEKDIPFGIRSYRFTPDQGFFLNGRHVQLRGGNIHHDFGGLGTALPDRAHEKNVEVLKEMGANFIRSSHNPAAVPLMNACDRHGMLLWAETRNLHPEKGAIEDLDALIRRDRNHPSIILWGLANTSGAMNGNHSLTEKLQTLHNYAKKLDPTRLTAIGLEGNADANTNGFANITDVVGYNGGGMGIDDRDHRLYPKRCQMISEYASARAARGIYEVRVCSCQETERAGDGRVFARNGSYSTELSQVDTNIKEWDRINVRPHLAGGGIWSAIDYRGETSGYPVVISQFGVLDICRFPKDSYYYYRKLWTKSPMIHLFPPLNSSMKPGTPIEVRCFTNCDSVEFLFNGKPVPGVPAFLQYGSTFPYFSWGFPYEKGKITAIGRIQEKEVCRVEMQTPEKPAVIRITPDRNVLYANGEDLSFVRIDIFDGNGTFVPDAAENLTISVEGQGFLRGVCSGDPASHEKEQGNTIRTFSGSALAIIQTQEMQGKVRIRVSGDGLKTAETELSIG